MASLKKTYVDMWISEVDKTKISVGDGKRSTKSKGGSSHDTELDSDDLMSIQCITMASLTC